MFLGASRPWDAAMVMAQWGALSYDNMWGTWCFRFESVRKRGEFCTAS